MPYQLEFEHLLKYDTSEQGISVPVKFSLGQSFVDVLAKLDCGASHCVFERVHGESVELGEDHRAKAPGRFDVVRVGSLAGLGHDHVHDAECVLVVGRHAHRQGRGCGLVRGAPQDGGAALGADHRIGRVLERNHDIADRNRERAA